MSHRPERDTLVRELGPWLRLLDRRRRRLAVGAALIALTLLSAIGLLALSGWFITATGLAGLLLAAGVAASLDVYVPGGGIRLFAVSRTLARYLERLYNHDTVLRLLADLRGRLFGVLAALDGLYLRLLAPAGVGLLAILGLVAFLALSSPGVGLAAGALLLLGWLWLTLGQAWLGVAESRSQVAELEALRGRLVEALQGMAELEAYGSLARHRHELHAIEARLYRGQRRLGALVALGNALAGLVVGLAMLLALWLAAGAWEAGRLSGPLMVMMPIAMLAMSEALAPLPAAFTWLGATRGAAGRLNELEARAGERAGARQAERGPRLPGGALGAELEAVTLRYDGALTPALDEVSLGLAPGERLALCGASGSGKSSVAGLLLGQLVPREGSVRLGGVALAEWPEVALSRRVAALTQRADLLDDSLAANLRIADPEAPESGCGRRWPGWGSTPGP